MSEEENTEETTQVGEEMLKPPVTEGKKAKVEKAEAKEKGVSKKEFTAFQDSVTTALGAIMEKLSETPVVSGSPVAAPIPKGDPDNGGPDNQIPTPPAWRKLTDEILGSDFEIELELPENGGQKFSIYVPREKSNAHPDYKAVFTNDKRTRELGNTGIKGVKDWLLRVRRNLVQSGIKLPYYEDNQGTLISTR